MSELAPESREGPGEPIVPPDLPPATAVATLSKTRAILEAVLCSSYPTQIVVASLLALSGVSGLAADGSLNATFVIGVAAGDAALVVALIVWFLRRRGESLRTVFVGTRPFWREVAFGIGMAPVVLFGVSLLIVGVRMLVPSLHNVPANPMGALMRDPATAALFAVVVVVAGGLREELQRGFQLHRLTPTVCGPLTALVITSVAFGAGHTVQGYDVAVATGALGALWGAFYLRRHSVVAAATSHGLFNLAQVVIAVTVGDRLP